MTKPVDFQDIKVETVKVTLKAMVIGPRQMTQSIFKQLVNEDILDQDALTLRGQPWGYVNYLVNESPDVARYIVWQKGSELRRCIVKRVTAKHDAGSVCSNTKNRIGSGNGSVGPTSHLYKSSYASCHPTLNVMTPWSSRCLSWSSCSSRYKPRLYYDLVGYEFGGLAIL
jgi:hypothetical protein